MPSTGTPGSKTIGIAARRALGLHRGRAAREDDAPRGEAADLLRGQVRAVDLAVDAQLADAPGDQLGVLAAEVEDQDLLSVDVHEALRASLTEGGPYRYKLWKSTLTSLRFRMRRLPAAATVLFLSVTGCA